MTKIKSVEPVSPEPVSPEPIPPISSIINRGTRYQEWVSQSALKDTSCLVVGVGAVGRPLALMLASMGVGSITVCDPDTVSIVNLGTQGWHAKDIGLSKADLVAEKIIEINPEAKVVSIPDRFQRFICARSYDAVFSCVDDMQIRRFIMYQCHVRDDIPIIPPLLKPPLLKTPLLKTRVSLADGSVRVNDCGYPVFIETRMGPEFVQVYTIPGSGQIGMPHPRPVPFHVPLLVEQSRLINRSAWLRLWFPSSEAHSSSCTNKSTVHVGSFSAAIAANEFFRAVARLPTRFRVQASITDGFLDVMEDTDLSFREPRASSCIHTIDANVEVPADINLSSLYNKEEWATIGVRWRY